VKELVIVGSGPALSIPNPIQAEVGGYAIQQARGMANLEVFATIEQLDEYFLAHFERLILILQQLAAAPNHHRTVPPEQILYIHRDRVDSIHLDTTEW
jgi:hypothetical protein